MAEGYKMKPGSTRRASLTPEENMARAFRAKCRFKAAVRFVMQNIYWLDDIAEEEIGDDVQKNIMALTRKKEKKSLLSITEKAILNKPADERTETEKLRLNRVIGGLKCFRRYPAHVKQQLAGVTYYVYYGPGRCIVRENDEAHALYFIVTGLVNVSIITFDPVLNQKVKLDLAVMGPGSMFGEVSLLHNIKRTATCHTSTHCELLCLKKDDFNVILKQSVQHDWDQIQNAMRLFTYFDEWDEIAKRECCIMAKIKKYKADEVILGDTAGQEDCAYFVIKGQCVVIQHLLIKTQHVNGKKRYVMYEPSKLEIATEEGRRKANTTSALTVTDIINKVKKKVSKIAPQRSISAAIVQQSESLHGNEFKERSISSHKSKTVKHTQAPKVTICLPQDVETHFMQVCFLNETACFGIGESFSCRRIVATVPTACLLIPRYWLLQKNKGNIWNRIVQFLNNNIPSNQQVFEQFKKHKKWVAYRKQIVGDLLKKNPVSTGNCIHNIPYSIRLKEYD